LGMKPRVLPSREAEPVRETPAQTAAREATERASRAERIKREVASEFDEANETPAASREVKRGEEDVGEKVTGKEVEEATEARTRTSEVKTRAEAEGRTPDPELKSDMRAASKSSKEVHASDLLHDMIDAPEKMSPTLAHTRYGVKEEGTRGAPRKFPRIFDYV